MSTMETITFTVASFGEPPAMVSAMNPEFGVRSMTARLRRVAVRTPTLTGDFASAGWRATPTAAIRDEHRGFVETLEGLGAQVHVLPAIDGQVDSVYTYDPAFVTSAGLVVFNQIKPARVPESKNLAEDVAALGVPVIAHLDEGAYADGGDMMWLDEDTLVIGRGFRTNRRAIDQMGEILSDEGIQVLSYDMAAGLGRDFVTHLMSFISPVAPTKAVVHRPSLPVAFQELLEEREWTLIECDDDEYDTQGCNVLAVAPDVAVMFDSAPKVTARTRDAGVEVHTVHCPNIALGDGGPTCITRPIWRAN